MENHNLAQPVGYTATQAILGNPAAPFLNSLMTPGDPNAAQTSWASHYTNAAPGNHPSLPNYLWQEGGSNFGVFNDNSPYGPGGSNGTGGSNLGATNLSGLLQTAGVPWKTYQEDIDLKADAGAVLPQNQWTVPLNDVSGTSGAYTNTYNGSHQFDYATKHNGPLYFNATNGGYDTTPSNPQVPHYAPLQQLTTDLAAGTTGRYNLITPDQFNDAHTPLSGGFTYHGVQYTGDAAAVAQGDNFLSILVPQIQASTAYQNNGAIVIWWDETEGGDSPAFTLPEIVLSPLAKGNAYQSTLTYTHSSDLRTMQDLFGVAAPGGGYLGDANTPGTHDLSDLFRPGAVAASVPEPSPLLLAGLLALGLGYLARRPRGTPLPVVSPADRSPGSADFTILQGAGL